MADIVKSLKEARKTVLKQIKLYAKNPQKPKNHPKWNDRKVPEVKTFLNSLDKVSFTDKASPETISKIWKDLVEVFKIYSNEAMLCSEPIGFRDAFNRFRHKEDEISVEELIRMRRSGLNYIPLDSSIVLPSKDRNILFKENTGFDGGALEKGTGGLRVITEKYRHKSLNCFEHGQILYGTKIVRTNRAMGEYEDSVTAEYIIYDPRADCSSLLRARFLENLSKEMFSKEQTGLVIQLMKKIKIRSKVPNRVDEIKIMYIMALCEVIPLDRVPTTLLGELENKYIHELNYPYVLRPLEPIEASNHLIALINLDKERKSDDDDDFALDQRPALKPSIASEWNYPITGKRRKMIEKYIEENVVTCSHVCGDTSEECQTSLHKNLHIGHIFSQKWCNTYLIFQESKNHPDNLYLSCKSCNSTLSEGCPSKEMLRSINKNQLTIGDLIRYKGLLDK